jgi:hypothetical protein
MKPALLAVALLALPSILPAQRIVRGPYLQLGTPDSVVVRWRTDVTTESGVRVGADPARLDRAIQPKGKSTEHIVHVGGRQPATRGFFDHPAMLLSLYRLGSLVLDVEGNRLDAAFFTEKGERLDHFPILKGK